MLGIGTYWGSAGADVVGTDAQGFPVYQGPLAIDVWQNEYGCVGTPPIETNGGAGTAGSHWDEACFNTELMTGYTDVNMPLSKMTAASLEDLGYTVDYNSPFIDHSYAGWISGRDCCTLGRRNLREGIRQLAGKNPNRPISPGGDSMARGYAQQLMQESTLSPGKARVSDDGKNKYTGDLFAAVYYMEVEEGERYIYAVDQYA